MPEKEGDTLRKGLNPSYGFVRRQPIQFSSPLPQIEAIIHGQVLRIGITGRLRTSVAQPSREMRRTSTRPWAR
jgi:hypothetical protein